MKKKSQTMMFAIAAFAVTVTNVQAFGSYELLTQAGLSDDQVIAVKEAREFRRAGDMDAARDALIEAGIDEDVIKELRKVHREYKKDKQTERQEQINDLLTTDQKEALQVAHAANDRETVRAIFAEVGIELPEKGSKRTKAQR